MEKQELIKKVDEEKYGYPEMEPELIEEPTVEFKKGYNVASEQISRLIEQLDEPQKEKAKIPQCLADYIEMERARDIESIDEVFSPTWVSEYEAVDKWLYDNTGFENERRYLIAVKAYVEGDYEVEEEPKYRVNIGGLYLKEPLGDTNDFTIRMTWNEEYAYQFDSWNMAREHTSEIGGTVEKV